VLSAPLALTTVTWVPALLASTVVAGLAGWVVGSVVGKRRVPLWGALLLAGPPLLLGMAVQVVPAALLNLGLLFAYTEPTATGRHFSNHTLQRGLRKGETHVLVALALFGLLTTVGTGMALGSTAVAWWLVATGRPRTDGEPALSWDLLDVPEPST
jgi:hypothetical protein